MDFTLFLTKTVQFKLFHFSTNRANLRVQQQQQQHHQQHQPLQQHGKEQHQCNVRSNSVHMNNVHPIDPYQTANFSTNGNHHPLHYTNSGDFTVPTGWVQDMATENDLYFANHNNKNNNWNDIRTGDNYVSTTFYCDEKLAFITVPRFT